MPGDRHQLNCANSPCHPPELTAPQHGEVGGYQWASTLCMRCHGDGGVARVAQHQPFQIVSGFAHNKKGCLNCHPSLRDDRPALADFTSRNCFSAGCHIKALTSALHFFVANGRYQPEPSSSIQSGCHQNGTKP